MLNKSILLSIIMLLVVTVISFAKDQSGLKKEIYSKLKCCNCAVSFEKCTCAEANEIKPYADKLIADGFRPEEIFYRLAKRFSLKIITDPQIKQQVEKRLIKEMKGMSPKIAVENGTVNLGAISKKKNKLYKSSYKLVNEGNAALRISNIKTSCPCVSVALKSRDSVTPYFGVGGSAVDLGVTIEPGSSADLMIIFDLTHPSVSRGKLIRYIFINSNDPLTPQFELELTADIIK